MPFSIWRWEVPRIDDQILDSVIYLYPNTQDAQNAEAAGGTGFLVAVPSEKHSNVIYPYAVTNSHVIREAASLVIRFNAIAGDTAIVPTQPDHWVHHPEGDDIAVAHLGSINQSIIRFKCIHLNMLVTDQIMEAQNFGPGDDVFMVGRFIRHDGKQRNLPSVRFGNISMMPHEKIMHYRQYEVESFLIETRSLSGYSGSPVFVHIPPATHRPGDKAGITLGRAMGPWLLGVDWGHYPIYENVKESDRTTNVSEGYIVESNSGQMAVAPAWKLRELLDQERFVMTRKKTDEEMEKSKSVSPIVMDAQMPPPDDVFTKGSFQDALRKVSRKTSAPELKDSEK